MKSMHLRWNSIDSQNDFRKRERFIKKYKEQVKSGIDPDQFNLRHAKGRKRGRKEGK